MKRVLIILFYWPPSGGSSVQRWLHFANKLPAYGWEPVIYAPENAQYPETDLTLEKRVDPEIQIIRKRISEPYHWYRKFLGGGKGKNLAAGMTLQAKPTRYSSWKNNISIWIRGNLFIPDARMLWIRPSVKYLNKFLKSEKVDAIITTGPPHSIHLIGYHIHKKTKIPWLADFRDPWTNIDFYSELKLTKLADLRHHRLESKVLTEASLVVTIGEDMKREFEEKGARKVRVITNGYDEEDIPREKVELDRKFSLLHIGTFSKTRNSNALWKALQKMTGANPQFASDLQIKLVGNVDFSVLQSIEEHGLTKYLQHIEYLSHSDAMKTAHAAQVLLLMINNSQNARGILTGKFFEYLTSGRPILLVGPPDGDASKILAETETGVAVDFDNETAIEAAIGNYYEKYLKNTLKIDGKNIAGYSRQKLTEKLASALNELLNQA